MIHKKQAVNKKEQKLIRSLLMTVKDKYKDFYITKNNKRIFLTDGTNHKKLFSCLKQGDKIIFNENGLLLIIGYSDKSPRKYIKVLAKNNKTIRNLLRVLFWENIKTDLYVKLKKDNNAIKVFEKHGWKFFGSRGEEILLVRRGYDEYQNKG